MLNQQTRARIIAEETSRFMDGNFGQLDLTGSPDLNHPPAEEPFELQDRHGFNRVDESGLAGINLLKELLANPPRDVIEEIAQQTRNPELIDELAQDRAEEVANEFRRCHPGYLKCDANWRSMVDALAHDFLGEDDLEVNDAQDRLIANGYWTLQNLTRAYKELDQIGALEYPANHARPLKESERLRSAQLAANGDVIGAISNYVKGRIGEDAAFEVAFELQDPLSFTSDPKNRVILEEACYFCWEHYRVDYTPTPERRRFLRDYCAGRFVTVALLNAGWEQCKVYERDAMRSAVLNPISAQEAPVEGPPALDRLDDADIETLYHRTLREYARNAKRQSGVLV